MRLWHYELIKYLPDSQLIAQYREICSICKNHPSHILINYVYQYPKENLYVYAETVKAELAAREYKLRDNDGYDEYFAGVEYDRSIENPFPKHHTEEYLLICYYNLHEKFIRGQRDFTNLTHKALKDFVSRRIHDEKAKANQ